MISSRTHQEQEVYSDLAFDSLLSNPRIALKLFGKILEMQPRNWLYLWGLGAAYSLEGQWEEAIAEFTESAKLPGGENSINFFSLSMTHWQLDQKETAADWYKKGLEWMQESSIDGALQPFLYYLHSEASELLGIKIQDRGILPKKEAVDE